MEKTKKQRTINKLLTLMLAFVMVFTGMGIGSWGVDTAWADTITITFSATGISEGCYDNVIDLTDIEIGSTKIAKLYIKNVDINNDFRIGSLLTSNTDVSAVVGIDGTAVSGSSGRFKPATKQYYTLKDTQLGKAPTNKEQLQTILKEYYTKNCNAGLENYYFLGFTGSNFTEKYGLLIQITGSLEPLDRSKIDELIKTVWDGEKYTDNFYKESDRYNGSVSMERDNQNPTNGFWYELTKAGGTLETAKGAFAKQDECDVAYKNLQSAITNLIPKTEVNATALYEAAQSANAKAQADYTETSWKPFDAAKSAADAMLGKLYENGAATNLNRGPLATGEGPEGAIHQKDVDTAAQNLTDAIANLLRRGDESWISETTEFVKKLLPKLITQAEKAKEADYTAESWTAFSNALSVAKAAIKPEFTGFATDKTTAETYWKAYEDLYRAYYYNLVSANEFNVQFEIMDAASARANEPATGVSEEVKLEAGAKLFDLTAKYGYSKHSSSTDKQGVLVDSDGNTYYLYAVMINGVLVSQNFKTLQSERLQTGNPVLHPGDEVCFIPVMNPRSTMGATVGDESAYPWQYLDWVKTMHFETEDALTAEAGKPFTVTLKQAVASLENYDGKQAAASGMTLFTGDVKNEPGGKVETNKLLVDGKAVTTDEDGRAKITLYSEGWYLIQAYDLTADKMGSMPNYEADEWSKGDYHSVNSGASIWIYVGASSDAAKVKSELRAELDKVYKAYSKDIFRPENWAAIERAYSEGISGIKDAETIGTAYEAQQEAVVAIKNIQQQTETENETNVTNFRNNLNNLPDDMGLLSESVKNAVEELLSKYDGMSDYQKTLLTKVENDKYEKIKAKYAEGLTPAKNYTLTLNVVGDTDEATAALNRMTSYLKENLARQDSSKTSLGTGALIQKVFSFQDYAKKQEVTEAAPLTSIRLPLSVDYAAYFHVRDAEGNTISGEGWSISDGEDGLSFVEKPSEAKLDYYVEGNLAVTINNKLYEVKSVTYERIDESEVTSNTYAPMDYSTYKGKDKDKVNLYFKDAYRGFTMPYNNVTVTVTWGPIEVKSLDEAKTGALQELEEAHENYNENDYSASNWNALNEAYTAGKAAIKSATDLDEVAAAKKDAIGKMAGISKKSDTTAKPSDLGKEVGKVKVIGNVKFFV